MPQGGGISGKAGYGKRGCDGAVKNGESDRVGAEGKWDKGEGGRRDCKKSLYIEN